MNICMIVDDSEIVRKYTRLIFESLGYRAIEADSPQAAFERLTAEAPHLIIVDWRIPGANMHDFIGQLRRMTLNRRPYIVYLATENDDADMQRAMIAGADDFMLKPFNRDIVNLKLQDIRLAA